MKFVVALAIMASVGIVGAQVPDHLKCYKVKDSAAKALYTADLGGLAAEPGCTIKVPGTMLCVETEKQNITPTPPGGGPAPAPAGRFVCYKLKCPKAVLAPVVVSDQFGTRSVQPSTPKMLCAPEGTSTTTSSTIGTTTTSTSSTSTSTTLPPCGVDLFPSCGGECPNDGVCVVSTSAGTCFCINPEGTVCDALPGSCVSGGACPAGYSCVGAAGACQCINTPCGGTFPACNGLCGGGQTCTNLGVTCGCL